MKSLIIASLTVAVMSLASCGTVTVTSDRARAITNEQDWSQVNQRIERAKAERAAKAH